MPADSDPDDPNDRARVFIALGSNQGERQHHLERALELLDATPGTTVVDRSPIIETDPVGGPPQPDYLNAVCEIRTELSPRELLERLLEIERLLGRVRTVRNGPRTIDLDLLLYGDRIVDEPGLQVPHPRMTERRFVMEPLASLAPELVQPSAGRTTAQLLAQLRTEEASV